MPFEISHAESRTIIRYCQDAPRCSDFLPKGLITKLLGTGVDHIILDLNHCPHLDARGLGQLVGSQISARTVGAHFAIVNVSDNVRSLLRESRLHRLIEVEGEPMPDLSFSEDDVPRPEETRIADPLRVIPHHAFPPAPAAS